MTLCTPFIVFVILRYYITCTCVIFILCVYVCVQYSLSFFVRVTIVKDKESRDSRGVAFVLFIDKMSALKAVQIMNNRDMFGRTLTCSIAKDNGRTSEFIKRKVYKDKSLCYECGVSQSDTDSQRKSTKRQYSFKMASQIW